MELSAAAAILRKEPPPEGCQALLTRMAEIPIPRVSLQGPFEPVRKTAQMADTGLPMVIWGGANTSVDLQNARTRSDKSISGLLRRIQNQKWVGSSRQLNDAFEPVIVNATAISRNELAEPRLASAERHLRARDVEDAVRELDSALALNPDSLRARLLRCAANLLRSRNDSMFADADAAVKIAPKDGRAYYWRGLALNELSRYEEALRDAEQAVMLAPKAVEFLTMRAAVKRELRRYDDSLADFDRAVTLAPRSSFILFERGLTLAKAGRTAKALEDLSESLALSPRSVQTLRLKTRIHHERREYSEAVKICLRMVDVQPSSANYQELAENRLYAKDYEGAVGDFTAAILLDPRNAYAIMGRGLAFKSMRNYENAIRDLEIARSRIPALADVIQKRIDECQGLRAGQNNSL